MPTIGDYAEALIRLGADGLVRPRGEVAEELPHAESGGPPVSPAVAYRCRAPASRGFLNNKTQPDYDNGDRKEL